MGRGAWQATANRAAKEFNLTQLNTNNTCKTPYQRMLGTECKSRGTDHCIDGPLLCNMPMASLATSVGQKSAGSLDEWFWPPVFREVAIKQ